MPVLAVLYKPCFDATNFLEIVSFKEQVFVLEVNKKSIKSLVACRMQLTGSMSQISIYAKGRLVHGHYDRSTNLIENMDFKKIDANYFHVEVTNGSGENNHVIEFCYVASYLYDKKDEWFFWDTYHKETLENLAGPAKVKDLCDAGKYIPLEIAGITQQMVIVDNNCRFDKSDWDCRVEHDGIIDKGLQPLLKECIIEEASRIWWWRIVLDYIDSKFFKDSDERLWLLRKLGIINKRLTALSASGYFFAIKLQSTSGYLDGTHSQKEDRCNKIRLQKKTGFLWPPTSIFDVFAIASLFIIAVALFVFPDSTKKMAESVGILVIKVITRLSSYIVNKLK